MPELAEIFRRYGPEYIDRFGANMLPSHRRAISDIVDCRTEALGGHLVKCDHCQALDFTFHSCKNRACPKCHGNDTRRWLAKRRTELLDTVYFHVVFTLPAELREIVRQNQRALYGALLRAAADALMTLAADPQYAGARIGMLAVLHTWTNALAFHPHVHSLVPGSGVAPDGTARHTTGRRFLVPVRALSPIFRARFMAMARKLLPDSRFPPEVWKKDWVVYAKPAVQGCDQVLRYLGRYVHRIAITNNRILAAEHGQVRFRYRQRRRQKKKTKSGGWKTMTLPATQFMARFLQHVTPQGFHRVRYYGIWSPANRDALLKLRQSLASKHDKAEDDVHATELMDHDNAPQQAGLCRFCKQGCMVVVGIIPRQRYGVDPARSPPC